MTDRERRQMLRLLEQLYEAPKVYGVDIGPPGCREFANVDALVVHAELASNLADLPMLILALSKGSG